MTDMSSTADLGAGRHDDCTASHNCGEHPEWQRCDVVTGMNRNAIQDFVTCGHLLPCPLHSPLTVRGRSG